MMKFIFTVISILLLASSIAMAEETDWKKEALTAKIQSARLEMALIEKRHAELKNAVQILEKELKDHTEPKEETPKKEK